MSGVETLFETRTVRAGARVEERLPAAAARRFHVGHRYTLEVFGGVGGEGVAPLAQTFTVDGPSASVEVKLKLTAPPEPPEQVRPPRPPVVDSAPDPYACPYAGVLAQPRPLCTCMGMYTCRCPH